MDGAGGNSGEGARWMGSEMTLADDPGQVALEPAIGAREPSGIVGCFRWAVWDGLACRLAYKMNGTSILVECLYAG